MASIIQVRRDTIVNWTTNNPVLASGELGYETDTLRMRIGDGVTQFLSLPIWPADESALWGLITGDINNQTDLINEINARASAMALALGG